jgi:hypothetical protein
MPAATSTTPMSTITLAGALAKGYGKNCSR